MRINHNLMSLAGDRRRTERHAVGWAAKVTDATGWVQPCVCHDVSQGGLGLMVLRPLPIGSYAEITVTTPNGTVRLTGEVVRISGSNRVGLRFGGLDQQMVVGIQETLVQAEAANPLLP